MSIMESIVEEYIHTEKEMDISISEDEKITQASYYYINRISDGPYHVKATGLSDFYKILNKCIYRFLFRQLRNSQRFRGIHT